MRGRPRAAYFSVMRHPSLHHCVTSSPDLVARRPVRQPVLSDAVLQALAMHLQHADEEVARVARIDDVLRLVEPREFPGCGVALDLGDELLEAFRVILLLHAIEHVH